MFRTLKRVIGVVADTACAVEEGAKTLRNTMEEIRIESDKRLEQAKAIEDFNKYKRVKKAKKTEIDVTSLFSPDEFY